MSIMDDLKKVFSGVVKSKADTYVGIDIGSSYIKVAQVKKDAGQIILETYGSLALGPYDNDRAAGELTNLESDVLAKALANLLEQANVTAKNPVISISSASSLIFTLNLPHIDKKDLDGVVRSEARKYIPIPLTEVSLDWWVIPEQEIYGESLQKKQQDLTILVVAVRNEIIEKYGHVLTEVKTLSTPEYEIETFSAIRGSFKHELAPVLVIDFGASGTRMAVIEHGVIKKFNSVNRGSEYLTSSLAKSFEMEFANAEKIKRAMDISDESDSEEKNIIKTGLNYLFSEIERVIFDFEKNNKKPINKIILTGGGATLGGLRYELQSRYNIPTSFADPFSKVVSPDFLDEILEEAGPEFTVALGLALSNVK